MTATELTATPPPWVPGLRTCDDVVDGHKIWLLYATGADAGCDEGRLVEVVVAGEGPQAGAALRRWVAENLTRLGRAGLNREVNRATARWARFHDVDGEWFTVDTCSSSERAQRPGFDVPVLVMPL